MGAGAAEVRTWGQAATACVAHCGQCQRCQHVSVSRHWSDCSWFHACDYTKLETKVNGFRSGRVEPSMIDFSRAVTPHDGAAAWASAG